MSVVNTANFVIQAAVHGRPPVRTIEYTDDGPITTLAIPVIVTPFVSWWRHPIRWWKMRHLRADWRLLEEQRENDPALAAMYAYLDEKMDEAFLCGTGVKEEDVDY